MKKTTLLYIFGFLIMGIMVLMMFSSFDYESGIGYSGYNVLTNSDASLLYQISTDFVKHPGSIHDWDFGTCFYIFPNMIIMLVTSILFSNPSLAIFASSIILFALLIFLLNLLFHKIFTGISKHSLIISNLSILVFVVFAIKSRDFCLLTSHLFLPLHLGAFINSIAALILVFNYFNSKLLKYCIYLSIISILAIFSDMIYTIYFSIPLIFALVTILIFKKEYRRKNFVTMLISVILSAILGYIFHEIIVRTGTLSVMQLRRMPENIYNSFHILTNQLHDIIFSSKLISLIFFIALLSFCISSTIVLIKVFKPNQNINHHKSNLFFYFLFFFYFFIVTISAPILNGTYLGLDCIRYIMPAVYLAIFNTGLLFQYLLMNLPQFKRYIALISLSLVVFYIVFMIVNFSNNNPISSIGKVKNYYPAIVKAADELSKKYHVKNGLGEYWDARFITIFSKQSVTVNLIRPSIRPEKFANNPHYYYYTDYSNKIVTTFNFIVLRYLEDTSNIYKIFGKKAIKKVALNGNEFYLLPDFVANTDSFEVIINKTN